MKNYLIIFILLILMVVSFSCTKKNPFREPELFNYEDFDYHIDIIPNFFKDWINWCNDCPEYCYEVRFAHYNSSWEGLTTLKINDILYEDDGSNYFPSHTVNHAYLIPGTTYKFEAYTPLTGISVNFSLPYITSNFNLPDNFDVSKNHTISWETEGDNNILLLTRRAYCIDSSCPENENEEVGFYRSIQPNRRNFTMPGIDINSVHECDNEIYLMYALLNINYIISNRFLFVSETVDYIFISFGSEEIDSLLKTHLENKVKNNFNALIRNHIRGV